MLQSPILAIMRGKALAGFVEQAGNAAGQAARTVICSGGGLLLDNMPAFGPAGKAARELARGIHGGLCGVPTPPELGEPTFPPPPFTGGQCPGVLYAVRYTVTEINRFGQTTTYQPPQSPLNLTGPITGISVQGPKTVGGRPAFTSVVIAANPSATPNTDNTANSGFTAAAITNIVRANGQPDTCGNPPGPPPIPPPPAPPVPTPPDIDLPVTPPGGGPDVDYTFSPRIGPIFIGVGGGLIVPVNVRINGPNININAPISIPVNISLPDFNISFPGGGGGGGQPDDPSAPVVPGPPPRPVPGPPYVVCCDAPIIPGPEVPITDDEPIAPENKGRRLVGLLVRSTLAAGAGNLTVVGQGGGAQNLFLPRLSNVYFEVRAQNLSGVPRVGSTTAIPVQVLSQYVAAPEDVTVISWRIVNEANVSATVTPLYVPTNRT